MDSGKGPQAQNWQSPLLYCIDQSRSQSQTGLKGWRHSLCFLGVSVGTGGVAAETLCPSPQSSRTCTWCSKGHTWWKIREKEAEGVPFILSRLRNTGGTRVGLSTPPQFWEQRPGLRERHVREAMKCCQALL